MSKQSPQLKQPPINIQALLKEATDHHQADRIAEAEHGYTEILKRNPDQVDALHLLGVIHYQRRDYPKAIELISKACKFAPKAAIIHYNLGLSFLEYGEMEFAEEALLLAKRFDHHHYPTDFALAKVELNRGAFDKAWEHLQVVLEKAKDWWPALELKALILEKRQMWPEAIRCYESLLLKNPKQLNVLNNYAKMLLDINELPQAKKHIDTLLQIDPNFPSGLINLGLWHLKRNQYLEAISLYHQFLEQHPDHPIALSNLALCYRRNHQYNEAIAFNQKLLLHPDQSPAVVTLKQKALVSLCLSYQWTCQWDELNTVMNTLKSNLLSNEGAPLLTPFEAIMLNLEQPLLDKTREQYVNALIATHRHSLPKPNARPKYRIGYFSPDLGDHPVGLLLQHCFPFHNKDKYEVYMLSLKQHADGIHQQLKSHADHWLELGHLNHQEILQQVRCLELDLIIDLSGYTLNARPELLKSRMAYKQAHWLGYPGSLGHQCIDYFITSRELLPEDMELDEAQCVLPAWFSTKIDLKTPPITRADFGLPEDQFVFCCFQRQYRIDEPAMQAWIEILKQTPNSCLWLLSGGDEVNARLQAYAKKHGVDPTRLIFSEDEKLSLRFRHRLADLWLDTWHISSGTATVLTLAVDLPVLSLAGETMQSRTSSAILSMVDAYELICQSGEQYIAKAVELANNPNLYQDLKNKLAQHKQQSLLFNPQSFMPIFEEALTKMIEQDDPQSIEL